MFMADEGLLAKYLKNMKGKAWFLLLLLLAVLLLLFGGGLGDAASQTEQDGDLAARTEAYRLALEEDLCALCSRVSGAGEVRVLLTLDGTERAVYATDTGSNGQRDYVTSGGAGLLLYREYPAVRGVAVVCTGGADARVQSELTRLLAATLGIGSNCIYIGAG